MDAWVIFAKPASGTNVRGVPPVASGSSEQSYRLAPGKYALQVEWGVAKVTQEIEVPEAEGLEVTVILGAGTAVFTAISHDGGGPVQSRYYSIFPDPKTQPNAKMLEGGAGPRFRLPAGPYLALGTWAGAVTARQTFTIEAGEITEVMLNYNAGTLDLTTHQGTADGPKVRDVYYYIYEVAAGGGKGRQVDSAAQSRFQLNAGSYIIETSHQGKKATQTTEVKAGQTQKATLVLPSK